MLSKLSSHPPTHPPTHPYTQQEEEEEILQNGAILGFIEALSTQPVPHSYTAASFVHLLFFDK